MVRLPVVLHVLFLDVVLHVVVVHILLSSIAYKRSLFDGLCSRSRPVQGHLAASSANHSLHFAKVRKLAATGSAYLEVCFIVSPTSYRLQTRASMLFSKFWS
jgi:hypothetical protein